MKLATRAVLFVALFFVAVVAGRVLAEKDAALTIAETMRKLNGGTNSMTRNLELDLKDDDPDWEAIQESSAEYVKLVDGLQKGTPRKGDKASWERLTKNYAANARALDAAARKKDRKAAALVVTRIKNSCNACHDVHRPKDD
ncbi:MAG TPA: cytochrome c [Gemmataceae bacterium]|nr:cytochrome c [Gemmataceae bacterium]